MAAKLVLALASSIVALLALEVVLRVLPPEPDGFGQTRAAKRWFAKYWTPVNAAGFRDAEHSDAALRSTRRLVVLGDSFAAGAGIRDHEDRFSDRVASELGADWTVVLLARPGWNTGHQIEALDRLPYPPHAVVLAYYLNDVEGAAALHGRRFEIDTSVRPRWLEPLVGRSDLASFLYWRVRRARIWEQGLGYADFVYASFADDAIWATHAEQLRSLFARCRGRGAIPLAVAFPHLFDLPGSDAPLERVLALMADAGVPAVDVRDLIGAHDWGPAELYTGPMDPHPSAAVHAAVADALLPLIPR